MASELQETVFYSHHHSPSGETLPAASRSPQKTYCVLSVLSSDDTVSSPCIGAELMSWRKRCTDECLNEGIFTISLCRNCHFPVSKVHFLRSPCPNRGLTVSSGNFSANVNHQSWNDPSINILSLWKMANGYYSKCINAVREWHLTCILPTEVSYFSNDKENHWIITAADKSVGCRNVSFFFFHLWKCV